MTPEIEQTARDVVENAAPQGDGNYVVPGWAFRALWGALGSPPLTRPDAIFGVMPDEESEQEGQR